LCAVPCGCLARFRNAAVAPCCCMQVCSCVRHYTATACCCSCCCCHLACSEAIMQQRRWQLLHLLKRPCSHVGSPGPAPYGHRPCAGLPAACAPCNVAVLLPLPLRCWACYTTASSSPATLLHCAAASQTRIHAASCARHLLAWLRGRLAHSTSQHQVTQTVSRLVERPGAGWYYEQAKF
jgi:hypothetical protein